MRRTGSGEGITRTAGVGVDDFAVLRAAEGIGAALVLRRV